MLNVSAPFMVALMSEASLLVSVPLMFVKLVIAPVVVKFPAPEPVRLRIGLELDELVSDKLFVPLAYPVKVNGVDTVFD